VTPRRSIALVGRGSPEPPVALVEAFAGLLGRGFDVHLLCDGGDPGDWPGMSELAPDLARERVHPPPRVLQRRAPDASLLRGLAGGVVRHPWAALRAGVAGGRGDRRRLGDRYLDAVLLALRPSLVHFTSHVSALRRTRLARAFGARVLVSVSEAELERLRRTGRKALARLWRSADVMVFPNPWVHERALELGCPPKVPSALASHGANPAWFAGGPHEPEEDGHRPLRILTAGPLSWRQGLEHALDSVRLLVDRGVACEYRIAGAGDFEPAVGFGRHQLGLTREVTLLDPLGREELRDQLAWADVFLAPAVAPERTALAEAQAMAVPAVATERAAPAGVSVSGIEVPPRDPSAIADALGRLAEDEQLRIRLGREARDRAVQRYGAEQDASDLARVYANVPG
jgi:glycosyltransferase involved in cell wall biosynthesis